MDKGDSPVIHLILGGARSGKSSYAESQAEALEAANQNKIMLYFATAEAKDGEMADRIMHHQQSRSLLWTLIEEPYHLSAALQKNNTTENIVLIDCLTLWINNWLCRENNNEWQLEKSNFLQQAQIFKGQLFIVSNEVGSGIIPLGKLNRDFVDESGRLNQQLAAIAENVTFVTAGLPLSLKPAR